MGRDCVCLLCGKKIYSDELGGICPHCGKYTLFVSQPELFVPMEKSDGTYDFFPIFSNSSDCWVEFYRNKEVYNRLVNVLAMQEDVKIAECEYVFEYERNGHKFNIRTLVARALFDPLYDGQPFIAFSFVKKDDPQFEVYREELSRIALIIEEIDKGSVETLKCPNCKSENIHPRTVVGDKKLRNVKIIAAAFAIFTALMFGFALLANETNMIWPIIFSIFYGTPVCLVLNAILKRIPMRKKIAFVCDDCGAKYSKAALKKQQNM